jgi:hypothetical protein
LTDGRNALQAMQKSLHERRIPSDHLRLLDFRVTAGHPDLVGHSDRNQEPTPKYGDPAPLGGSFIVDFLARGRSMASGEFAVVATDKGAGAPPTPDKRRRDEMRAALKNNCKELLELVKESLLCASPEDWQYFWHNHIKEWVSLSDTIANLGSRLGIASRNAKDVAAKELTEELEAYFPEAAEELHFLMSVVESASKRAAGFLPAPEHQRRADFEIAARFHFWGAHVNMCLITLDLSALNVIELPMILRAQVFVTLRHAALEFNHATMQAAELRRADHDDDNGEVFHADVIEDDLEHAEELIRKYEKSRH